MNCVFSDVARLTFTDPGDRKFNVAVGFDKNGQDVLKGPSNMSKWTVACRITAGFTFTGPVLEHVLDLLYLCTILFGSSICGGLWPAVGGRIVHCGRNSCFCSATQNEFDGGRRKLSLEIRGGVTRVSCAYCGPQKLTPAGEQSLFR